MRKKTEILLSELQQQHFLEYICLTGAVSRGARLNESTNESKFYLKLKHGCLLAGTPKPSETEKVQGVLTKTQQALKKGATTTFTKS